jgi:hypothetical protein
VGVGAQGEPRVLLSEQAASRRMFLPESRRGAQVCRKLWNPIRSRSASADAGMISCRLRDPRRADLHVSVIDRMTLFSRGRFQRPAGVYLSIEDVDRGRGSRARLGLGARGR